MAIQMRRGSYGKLDPTKMLPGEYAVVQSGDPSARDGRAVYMAFAAGVVKRLATYEDMVESVRQAVEQGSSSIIKSITDAVNKTNDDVKAAETGRVTAEAKRVAAEDARVKAESQRKAQYDKCVTQTNAAASAASSANTAAGKANSAAQSANANADAANRAASAASGAAQQAAAAAAKARPYFFQAAEPARSQRADGMLWLQTNESARTAVARRWDAGLPGTALWPGASTFPGSVYPDQMGAWTTFAL